ncbi:hypothetical protein MMC18_000748 [Xylographa bjoerkii]|nr:hypothetical protein [Xylographa bjoerkii]
MHRSGRLPTKGRRRELKKQYEKQLGTFLENAPKVMQQLGESGVINGSGESFIGGGGDTDAHRIFGELDPESQREWHAQPSQLGQKSLKPYDAWRRCANAGLDCHGPLLVMSKGTAQDIRDRTACAGTEAERGNKLSVTYLPRSEAFGIKSVAGS